MGSPPGPLAPHGSCQEVGHLVSQGLAGLVLLCAASHLIAQFCCLSPKRLRRRRPFRRHHQARPERVPSTCRCTSKHRVGPTKEHKATQTWDSRPPRAKTSEHSSSWGDTAMWVAECREAPAGARPAQVFAYSLQTRTPSKACPLGQVIYDARWLHCMVDDKAGKSGEDARTRGGARL